MRALCFAALLAALSGTARAEALPCASDPALATAAAELLLADKPPDAAQLTAAAREAGSDAVGLRALYVPERDVARAKAWLTELRAKSDADLICGDARSATARLILASPRAGSLRVEGDLLRGALAPGFDRPELVLRSVDGEVIRLAVLREELGRGVAIDPAWRAVQAQLTAWSASGPRPVAERVLGDPKQVAALGDDARGELSLFPEGPLDARGVADVLARLRERHRRHALRMNRLAARVAEGHARDVCAQGRVVHALEPGVDPEVRAMRAGLRARLVGETVARAATAAAALQSLWHSPSHALTLLEPRFTDVGIGLATDEASRTCLVILLLSWPRPIPRASTAAIQ